MDGVTALYVLLVLGLVGMLAWRRIVAPMLADLAAAWERGDPRLDAEPPRMVGRVSVVTLPARDDYVAHGAAGEAPRGELPGRGNAEEEDRREAEAGRKAPGALTASDINRLLEEAREQGAARALGTLLGADLLVDGGRSRAMEALFGPAGRRHTRVRPWVAEAEGAARAARPDELAGEEAPRVVTVNAGRPDERKLVL